MEDGDMRLMQRMQHLNVNVCEEMKIGDKSTSSETDNLNLLEQKKQRHHQSAYVPMQSRFFFKDIFAEPTLDELKNETNQKPNQNSESGFSH